MSKRKKLPVTHCKRLSQLAYYLRELRYSENLTQTQVAQQTNMTKNSLVRIETIDKDKCKGYNILHIYELADFYGVPAKDILWNID